MEEVKSKRASERGLRSRLVGVSLSPPEYELIRDAATRRGLRPATFFRTVVMDVLEQRGVTITPPRVA
jgi:hypothetical protein